MSPEVIISKPRKILNHTVGVAACIVLLPGIFAGLQGVFLPIPWIVGVALAFMADRIKYKYVKRVEAAGYELV